MDVQIHNHNSLCSINQIKPLQNQQRYPTQKNPQQTLASFDKISCDDIENPQFQQAVLNAINEIRKSLPTMWKNCLLGNPLTKME